MKYAKWTLSVLALVMLIGVLPSNAEAQDDRSGLEMWAQTCGNCHQNQPAGRYSKDYWISVIAHMRIEARLTDAEAEAILAFLTRRDRNDDDGTEASVDSATPAADKYIQERGGVPANKPATKPKNDTGKKDPAS